MEPIETEQASAPTQTEHPYRATIRTAFAVVIALAVGAPLLIEASGAGTDVAGVAVILAVAAAITRVMALPWTNEFLERFIPWLAAAPKSEA